MARKRNATPSYLAHTSGRARAVWTGPDGIRHFETMPGPFGSDESKAAFAALQLKLVSNPAAVLARCGDATVNEVVAAYVAHAERYYIHGDGTPTSEVREIAAAVKIVRVLFGATLAAEFGPRALATCRQKMIDSNWCRTLINKRIDRVKRAMKWAVAEEMIPATVYDALRALAGLRRGRTTAKESKPVKPVSLADVGSTLPFLPVHIRALIEIIMLTGMRPGEACAMTLGQIDRTSKMWCYHPTTHKTVHHGKARVIPFGPRARSVLANHLAGRILEPTDPIFSPLRAREERFASMRTRRKSKVTPSQQSRKKDEPEHLPAEYYEPHTVAHAVRVAAKKAGVDHWSPYQLRHAFATRVRRDYGLESAQVLLGHARADVTQVYAERNVALAKVVAAKIG